MADPYGRASGAVALIAGRYELIREVGTQADLVLWEGFDTSLERAVLVQLLRRELLGDDASAERFWSSARSAANSPGSPGERILDAGTDPETGRAFVVREWPQRATHVDRDTLATRLRTRLANPSGRFDVMSRPIALACLLVVAVLGVSALRWAFDGWRAWVNQPPGSVLAAVQTPLAAAQSGAPAPTTTASAAAAAAAKPTAAAAPTTPATPQATPTPEGVTRRIANTDGRGVALRDGPGGARLPNKGYDEGATVQAFESSGEWTRIRGSDGREGWVLTVTLSD